jgi:uncharacterized protein involved in outer membrane biogenesis
VKRFIRIALLAAGAIVALCAIALIGLNLYVQSQGTQARIQQELSQRLGTELHINAVSVTPWGGLTLNGITIPQAWPGNSGDFLTAKSFHLHVSFVSLFSRRLLITKVSLLEPTVVWPQNADGKWRLPGERREETSNVEAATSHSPPTAGLSSGRSRSHGCSRRAGTTTRRGKTDSCFQAAQADYRIDPRCPAIGGNGC